MQKKRVFSLPTKTLPNFDLRKSLKMADSSDSNSDGLEIRYITKSLKRKHDENDLSGTEAMQMVPSPPDLKITWTKKNELDILQLTDKVKKLKRRFRDNNARSIHVKRLSFTNAEDEEGFRLSTIIWADNETEYASNEKMHEEQQPKEVLVSIEDVPCTEDEQGSHIKMVEKEKSFEEEEEDGGDEFCVLQEVLEAAALFQTLGKNQQKLLCQNLKNLPRQSRKELTDEWMSLLDEEMKLNIKKLAFSSKLANSRVSA